MNKSTTYDMKRHEYLLHLPLGAALCGLALAACHADLDEPGATDGTDSEASGVTMTVGAAGTGTSGSSRPVFLFWDASTFLRTAATVDPEPELFYVSTPSQAITAYAPGSGKTTDVETWYDTGHAYLRNSQTVLVSGFSPERAAPDAQDTTKTLAERYARLCVPPELLGEDSLYVASGVCLGSETHPFSSPLQFVHASARLIVTAKLATGMPWPVKNVAVEQTDVSALLYRMTWKSYETADSLSRCGYVCETYNKKKDWDALSEAQQQAVRDRLKSFTYTANLPAYDHDLNGVAVAPIDTFYLRPGTSAVTLNITATMGGTESYQVRGKKFLFKNAKGKTITLQSGDSYELRLLFSKEDIQYGCQKLDFEDGGNFYVSIQPFETSTEKKTEETNDNETGGETPPEE
jgi:hypothetical protein